MLYLENIKEESEHFAFPKHFQEIEDIKDLDVAISTRQLVARHHDAAAFR